MTSILWDSELECSRVVGINISRVKRTDNIVAYSFAKKAKETNNILVAQTDLNNLLLNIHYWYQTNQGEERRFN